MSHPVASELFSRQQIAAAVSLGNDTLSYWLKSGLLRAREGEGGGKGVHRRFGYEALRIAAILAEMSRYGANTNTLGVLAKIVWDAWTFGQQMARYTEADVLDWVTLMRARERMADDPAQFDEWLAERTGNLTLSPLAFELEREQLDPLMELVFALYFDLFCSEIGEILETRWHAAPTEDGEFLIVPEATDFSDLSEKLPSRIELNVSLIITMAWGRLHQFNQMDRASAATPTRS